ncbi:MAG: MotA/TolQ/ExbB proton channel family protein [Verrucomicrobiales bacterium]|nr:MotA/TolQ/ExbB proton channel family protein [Verrucomicrobiales bacterium]
MSFLDEILRSLHDLSNEGGWIFWMLIALAFAITANLYTVAVNLRAQSADEQARILRRIDFCFVLIGAAPLVGLLGTVSGMLATFSGLAVSSGAAPVETISDGISKALITTQTGLVIAIPTFIVCTLLKRRQQNLIQSSPQPLPAT